MLVSCDKCGAHYDDTYRWTYCPHDKFAMCTVVSRPDGTTGIATTIEQADRIMKGEE